MVTTCVKSLSKIVNIKQNVSFHQKQILSCKALIFIADMHLNFNQRIVELNLNQRSSLTFTDKLPASISRIKQIRNSELAEDFYNRKIEYANLTQSFKLYDPCNPTPSLTILDFGQTSQSTWEENIEGHIRLRNLIHSQINLNGYEDCETPTLVDKMVPFIVQLNRLRLVEEYVIIDKAPVSAAIFNFGLFFFHNAKKLIEHGYSPYFYLPHIETLHDAKLWNDIFNFAEEQLGLPKGIAQAVV
ncbi:MAG: hypothetical protein HXY50_07015 [Ignavibacteriaceae bacterium]|nr:hypothetical protein [Ignavibacteriaceae bacterium]